MPQGGVWISKSDKLLEDAQRDWSALGMERLLVTPLSRFPQGKDISLSEGILFTTYATLRSDERGERVSLVRQIVEWLGSDFDGVIIFDEQLAVGPEFHRCLAMPSLTPKPAAIGVKRPARRNSAVTSAKTPRDNDATAAQSQSGCVVEVAPATTSATGTRMQAAMESPSEFLSIT